MRAAKRTKRSNAVKHQPAKDIPAAPAPEIEPKKMFWYFAGVFKNKIALLAILFIAFAVGISSQLNWIQLKCEAKPFFTDQPEFCRHNLLRVVFAGPLAFLLLWAVVSFLRWRNNRRSLTFLAIVQLLLLPFASLPFIQDAMLKIRVTNLTALIYFIVLLAILRKDIWNLMREIGSLASLRIKTHNENGILRLSFIGRLSPIEAAWLAEAVTGLSVQLSTAKKKVIADVSRLEEYQGAYAYIFVLLAGVCASKNCTLVIVGSQQLCRQIQEEMLSLCQNVALSASDLHYHRTQ